MYKQETMKNFFVSAICLFIFFSCKMNEGNEHFASILQETSQKDFFTAREIFLQHKNGLSEYQTNILQAILGNSFNQLEQSETSITLLFDKYDAVLPDSIRLTLLDLKQDNASKQYRYKDAREAVSRIIDNLSDTLTSDELENYQNMFKLWTSLEDQPEQEVIINDPLILKMETDKVGLKNLTVTSGDDSANFIFDTGANLSTVSMSTAKKMNMKVLPDSILVGTITGNKVYAHLAICEKLYLGTIEIRNSVFLVFNDRELAFPQIDYQIQGIIGFPIMAALGEIQITKDGLFNVPATSNNATYEQNLALDHLSPILRLEGKHYNFDTGADGTILFKRYFDEHREEIESNRELSEIPFGGAGGHAAFDGYYIDFSPEINGQKILIPGIPVIKETISSKWDYIYGNIGQDLIGNFNSMTINFNNMFVHFD